MKFNAMRYRVPLLKRIIPSIKKRLARIRSHNGYFVGSSQGIPFLLNTENFVDRQIAF